MSLKWYQLYDELRNFLTEHPEIQIENNFMVIPDCIRDEFYRLFNAVRVAFLEQQCSSLLDKAKFLGETYVKIEKRVINLLGLREISIARNLHSFLDDPKNFLMRRLFDPLFYLLKEKTDVEIFEKEVSKNVKNSYEELYHLVYKKWVILSLIEILKANKSFAVITPPLEMSAKGPVITIDPKPVPQPQESNYLSFEHEITPAFIVPEIIIHASRIKRYVSFRSGLEGLAFVVEVMWTASKVSEKREWYNIKSTDSLLELESSVIIYVNDCLKDAALIADSERICRPDLIVECVTQDDHFEKTLERINLYINALKPKRGTLIVSENSDQKLKKYEKQREGIRLLTVGFNQSKLGPIINTLTSHKTVSH